MVFFSKKNSFLGVDFGSRSIKVVELTLEDRRARLSNYATVAVKDEKDRGPALRALLKKMRPRTKNAYVSLPGSSGLVTLINFPRMSKSELAEAVAFEARKHIPLSLADVNVSWDVVGVTRAAADASPSENKGKSSAKPASAGEKKELMQVLLVAAPKKDVSRYESYLKGTQLILRALELESFALVRSLIGEDEGTFLLVDIGAESTNIVLVKNGIVYLSRNIGVGGVGVTSAVQEALGISEDRAESHKREVSLLSGSQAIAVPALEAVVEEVRRVIKAASDMSIDGIVLAGGTAQMRDLKKYFADKLGREVVLGNPWARINCDERLKSVLASTGGGFSIAVGLALRGLEEYKRQ